MAKKDLVTIMESIAKKKLVKIVICEGWDERCIQASAEVIEKSLATLTLLGNKDEIIENAKRLGVDISEAEIIDFKNSELKDELAEKLFELRKHKGMTIDQAKKLIENENYFGCMYAYAGYADAVGGSAICSTADLMRPALQVLRKPGLLVSEVAIMTDVKNDRYMFCSDSSMNIDPTPEELCQIALNAAECVRNFSLIPKIAVLSYSSKGSGGDSPALQQLRKAVELVKEKDPSLMIDGELQVDAAVNPWAASRKCPDSPLKGEANTLIFPNLTASNIFVHSMLQFSDARMEFSMMKGMLKPVAIFGRSNPKSTIRNMIVSLAMDVNSEE